jgi:uncharacterized phiE125 gp8 family phage protein
MVNYNSVIDIEFNDAGITEPVTLTEAKDFCKIDIGTDDALITALITAARQQCEAYTGVGFVNRELTAVLNNINGDIYIPYGPIIEVLSVTDADGTELILGNGYKLSGITFKRLESPRNTNITVNYLAGYDILPEVLKTAILNQVFYLYDNRAQAVDDVSPIAKTLLNIYRRV